MPVRFHKKAKPVLEGIVKDVHIEQSFGPQYHSFMDKMPWTATVSKVYRIRVEIELFTDSPNGVSEAQEVLYGQTVKLTRGD